jgi:hypothetical protein
MVQLIEPASLYEPGLQLKQFADVTEPSALA